MVLASPCQRHLVCEDRHDCTRGRQKMVIRRIISIAVVLSLFSLIVSEAPKQVIVKGSNYLRPSAGSDVRHGRFLRSASGSDILGPGIDLSYGEYGQQQDEGSSFGRQDGGRFSGEIGFFGTSAHRGSAGRNSENAYLGDHRAAHADHQDAGYYGNGQGARNGYNQGGAVASARGFNNKGAAAAAVGSRGGHRKGHHSSGFHNSYHKDESGNSSTFYDDEVDNGEHYFYNGRDGAYDDRGANVYKGSFQDGAFQANARGNQGRYGAANGYDDVQGRRGSYNRDEYSDNVHKNGQERGGQGFYKNLHGGQQQNGGAYYGKAGEGYGSVVKKHGSVYKPVPYIPPTEVYDYSDKDYYPITGKDYYPVSSYGSSGSGGYYDKAGYVPADGFATVVDSGHVGDGYLDTKPKGYGGYYGIYRGVAY